VLFRQAFCGSPSCSASRTALMTGQYPHTNGVIGLVHRGFSMHEPERHLSHLLKVNGYATQLFGFQHEVGWNSSGELLGYDDVQPDLPRESLTRAQLAADWLAKAPQEPFFLNMGFVETHRVFSEVEPPEDERYTAPLPYLPDTPAVRRDVAELQTDVRHLDEAMGIILDRLDTEKFSDNTLVIYTTDHGLAFPRAKATLFDAGTGVALVMRGPGFEEGLVTDALLHQIDLLPSLCDYLDIPVPEGTQGVSQLDVMTGESDSIRDEVFTELTYHASYDPARAVRTDRHKYIRHFEERPRWVLPNTDNGHSKTVLSDAGLPQSDRPSEYLFDLCADPQEFENLAQSPGHQDILKQLSGRLDSWMEETDDPMRTGYVPPQDGATITPFDQFDP
ncbi:MAG: sulfatase, partial [Candidatus Latescibacteria bacterium]|nr:sulfatase [Candidatus Latescibacterota bacterium]